MSERYCPKCGTQARENARFCAACGGEVPEAATSGTGTVIADIPNLDLGAPAVPPVASAVPTSVAPAAAPMPTVPVSAVDTAPASDGGSVPPPIALAGAEQPAAITSAEYVVFPWWQVIVLSIISVGVWTLYWFYCTRKQVSALITDGKDNAGIQTFGYLVPIWQCWIVRDMWRDINEVAKKAGTTGIDSKGYTVAFVLLSYVPIVNYFSFVIAILYLITQSRFMAAMRALSGGHAIARRLTAWSAVWGFGPLAVFVLLGLISAF